MLNFEYKSIIINISDKLMELNMSRKVKLRKFYENSLIKKQKIKEINCDWSGIALSDWLKNN